MRATRPDPDDRAPLHVRPARPRDIHAIASLVERYWAFESIAGFDRSRIERLLDALLAQQSLGACWVAEDGSLLAGYLVAVFLLSLEHGGVMAEIDELFVSVEYRSRGVGARLLEAAERGLAARGMVMLQLQLAAHNEAALGFYMGRGFRPRSRFSLLEKPLGPEPPR